MKPVVKLVNTIEGFQGLQNEWGALYKACGKSTVFSSWDWMFTWWEVFQNEFSRKLHILCFYQDQKLIGVAPFQICKIYPKYFVQGRTLQFLGTGNKKESNIMSQYLDLIVLPGKEAEIVSAVSEYLMQEKKSWDFADFEYLLKDALILQCFKIENSKISRKVKEDGVRFFIPKFDNFDQYKSSMGNRWRKMFNKKSRALERDGDIKIVSTSFEESPEPDLKLLADMHCSRWKSKLGQCVFEYPSFYAFHQKILQRLLPQNKASIKTLYLNDEAIASYYIFADKGQWHYYQSGFYVKYANRYSPLFQLVCKEIGMAIEQEKMFDFMYTDSSKSYKKEQYAADFETMYRLYWSNTPVRFFIFDCSKYIQEGILNYQRKVKAMMKSKLSTSKKRET